MNARDCEHGRQIGKCETCELDQLREQNTMLDAACAKLEALNAELVEALRLVTVYCGNLHHAKGDRHPMGEPCPVEAKIRAVLARAEGK